MKQIHLVPQIQPQLSRSLKQHSRTLLPPGTVAIPLSHLSHHRTGLDIGLLLPTATRSDLKTYFIDSVSDAHIFVTEKGYMGLCPNGTQISDHVVLLAGGKVPFILRTRAEEWELKAEAGVEKQLVVNFMDEMSMYYVLPDPFAEDDTADAGGDVPGKGLNDSGSSGADAQMEKKSPWFELIGESYVHGIVLGSA
jgi:hypothetical protein